MQDLTLKQAIGITSAMSVEFNYIKRILRLEKTSRKGGYKVAIGSIDGIHLVLIRTGIGLEKARKGAKFILSNYNPKAIINVGIAGAVKPGFKIGDLVLGRNILLEEDNRDRNFQQLYHSNENMLNVFTKILSAKENPWYMGTIVSVKKGVFSKKGKNNIYRKYNADAVDMEAAAVIKACDNVPFAAIKSISDTADESIGLNEDILNDDGSINFAKMLKMFICQPFLTVTSIRNMIKNIDMALSRLQFFEEDYLLMNILNCEIDFSKTSK